MENTKSVVKQLLDSAGITIDGANAFDIKIFDEQFYEMVMTKGSIGLAEAYYKKIWSSNDLPGFFHRLFLSNAEAFFSENFGMKTKIIQEKFPESISPAQLIPDRKTHETCIEEIFNSSNITSSGYWQEVYSLKAAQHQKFKLICEKLKLAPGDTLLDINCGWGAFAHFAAKNYKVKVIGLTTSKTQFDVARKICKGLNVEIRNHGIMATSGQFDKIVDWNLMGNPGLNQHQLFTKLEQLLPREGIGLLNFITGDYNAADPWLNKHIFPEVMVPAIHSKIDIIPKNLILEDLQNFGLDFDTTIANWQVNLKDMNDLNHTSNYSLMWQYFQACFAASFRARRLDILELVLTRKTNPYIYEPVRFYQKNSYE